MKGMNKALPLLLAAIAILVALASSALSQSTTGTVSMNATVSRYVELDSGGGVTLTGNSGGGITTNGIVNNPLAVVVNLGELGPSNTNSFVTANVPLKLRSNAAYTLSLSATITGATSANRVNLSDIGFGLGAVSRTGTGVNTAGTDTNLTSGDPTLAANGSVNATTGRWDFTATRSDLGSFTTTTAALTGAFIMNAVPRANTNGLTVPAIFAVKPQFYENGSTTVVATFTITAP